MGEVRHLPFETLSAFVDGELHAAEAAAAQAHVDVCVTCRAEIRSLASLEGDLRLAPTLTCDAADALISAAHDGEADDAEVAVADRHLAACALHRKSAIAWATIDAALVASLSLPSARVDRAVAALTAPKPAPSGPRPTGAVGVALRGAAVAALALAVALAGSLTAQAPATPVATERKADALVASVQQVVLHARTNTLYVAEPETGTVRALDATTYGLRAQIAVGGRPTALALNPVADRVVVLDAVAKRVSEIDPETNAVVGTSQITAAGTPTSLQVDSGGKVVVALVPEEGRAPRAAVPTPTAGTLAVLDTSTKQLEIRSVDVAPRLVVPDPARQRTLLVSESATTIADASYRTIETIAGGISAAFSRRSDKIAVAARDADGSRLVFHGEKAPSSVRIEGKAASVIALPEGGFAVLTERSGRGRIVLVDESGAVTGSIDLEASGADLAYDEQSKRFTVVSAAGAVTSASLEPVAAASSPTPAATRAAAPTASALP
ncbi:MAG TPA: zf-HC2 domain-containing protein, partial [Candidatus Limnocylindria bacterium]|nr:zf-HC2 domain-containing protein [Candidatus Limnocylindria bacterium]